MKLIYIANARIPTEKAHGIQIMKMCEAFSTQGLDVELIVPRRLNTIKQDPFKYYEVKNSFSIKKIPTIDAVRFGKLGFLIQSIFFAKLGALYVLFANSDIIYSRDEWPLFFLSFFNRDIVFEIHTGAYNFAVKRVLKKSKKIVVITQGLKDFYIAKGVNEDKMFVSPDGVDLKQFRVFESKEECREKLVLPQDRKIIMYTGHLYSWKGVETLARSSKYLNKNEIIIFVGGMDKDIVRFKNNYGNMQNILILGQKPHKEIPYYLKASNVLVLPNSGKYDISKYYTSPMKLFEYMASGIPIVASSLPAIKEILNQNNSVLVKPDNPIDLFHGIDKVLQNQELADTISRQALKDVQDYTWDNRAKNILNFIKND